MGLAEFWVILSIAVVTLGVEVHDSRMTLMGLWGLSIGVSTMIFAFGWAAWTKRRGLVTLALTISKKVRRRSVNVERQNGHPEEERHVTNNGRLDPQKSIGWQGGALGQGGREMDEIDFRRTIREELVEPTKQIVDKIDCLKTELVGEYEANKDRHGHGMLYTAWLAAGTLITTGLSGMIEFRPIKSGDAILVVGGVIMAIALPIWWEWKKE